MEYYIILSGKFVQLCDVFTILLSKPPSSWETFPKIHKAFYFKSLVKQADMILNTCMLSLQSISKYIICKYETQDNCGYKPWNLIHV